MCLESGKKKKKKKKAGEELVIKLNFFKLLNLKITCHLGDGSYYFHQDGLLQSSN